MGFLEVVNAEQLVDVLTLIELDLSTAPADKVELLERLHLHLSRALECMECLTGEEQA